MSVVDIKKKRTLTKYIYYTVQLFNGLENSGIAISIIYYLQNDVKVSNAKVYASFIMAIFGGISSIASVLFGRYTDKTRNVKYSLLSIIFIAIIGNILYTFHSNICWVIIGRMLVGFIGAADTIISGKYFITPSFLTNYINK